MVSCVVGGFGSRGWLLWCFVGLLVCFVACVIVGYLIDVLLAGVGLCLCLSGCIVDLDIPCCMCL